MKDRWRLHFPVLVCADAYSDKQTVLEWFLFGKHIKTVNDGCGLTK